MYRNKIYDELELNNQSEDMRNVEHSLFYCNGSDRHKLHNRPLPNFVKFCDGGCKIEGKVNSPTTHDRCRGDKEVSESDEDNYPPLENTT
jgi:hypothetical protein